MVTFQERIQVEIDRDRANHAQHGWEQTPRRPGRHTIGDFVRATMGVDNIEEARLFHEGYVEYLVAVGCADPTATARANIGWCFGEGMTGERIAMWRATCDAAHPICGTAIPTPEMAFVMGQQVGRGGGW